MALTKDDLRSIERMISGSSSNRDKEFQSISSQIDNLETSVASLSRDLSDIKSKQDALERSISDISSSIPNSEIESISKQLVDITRTVAEIDKNIG